jgi:hypothetical protein
MRLKCAFYPGGVMVLSIRGKALANSYYCPEGIRYSSTMPLSIPVKPSLKYAKIRVPQNKSYGSPLCEMKIDNACLMLFNVKKY